MSNLERSLPFWRLSSSSVCLLLPLPNPTCALQLVSRPNPTLVFLPVWWRVWRGEHTRLLKTEVGEKENFGKGKWSWEVQVLDDVEVVEKSVIQTNLIDTTLCETSSSQVVAPDDYSMVTWPSEWHNANKRRSLIWSIKECKYCQQGVRTVQGEKLVH